MGDSSGFARGDRQLKAIDRLLKILVAKLIHISGGYAPGCFRLHLLNLVWELEILVKILPGGFFGKRTQFGVSRRTLFRRMMLCTSTSSAVTIPGSSAVVLRWKVCLQPEE